MKREFCGVKRLRGFAEKKDYDCEKLIIITSDCDDSSRTLSRAIATSLSSLGNHLSGSIIRFVKTISDRSNSSYPSM